MSRRTNRHLSPVLAAACVLAAGSQQAGATSNILEPDPIIEAARAIALELADGLNQTPVKDIVAEESPARPRSLWRYLRDKIVERSGEAAAAVDAGGLERGPGRTIAFWPAWEEELGVSESFVRTVNDAVLAELLPLGLPDDRFIARENLWQLQRELDQGADLRQSSARIAKLMREVQADVLIMAEMRPGGADHLRVSYRAINVETGRILAKSRARRLAYDFDRAETLSLDEAIRHAAAFVTGNASGLDELALQTMTFQETGVETSFGRWFLSRLAATASRQAGGRRVSVNIAELEPGTRELSLQRRSTGQRIAAAKRGRYVLAGAYWDLGDLMDIQISLTGGRGSKAVWAGTVRKSTVPGTLTLKPEPGAPPQARLVDTPGPVTLSLSTARGRNPSYRFGDRLVLLFEASAPSHLYCFYRQVDGSVFRIFPNRHHESSRIEGGQVVQLPSASAAFDWVIKPPAGIEYLKCFATDREVLPRLPEALGGRDFEPLSIKSMRPLTRAFRSIPGIRLAENAMIVNIRRDDAPDGTD